MLACAFDTREMSLFVKSCLAIYIRGWVCLRKRKNVAANIKRKISFVRSVQKLKNVKNVLNLKGVVAKKRNSLPGLRICGERFISVVLLGMCV